MLEQPNGKNTAAAAAVSCKRASVDTMQRLLSKKCIETSPQRRKFLRVHCSGV